MYIIIHIYTSILEEMTGNVALEVPQWFIAVSISPDHTFYKTNGCQAGTLDPFEKSKLAAKMDRLW